jgi:CheY-like chemotaxis protein
VNINQTILLVEDDSNDVLLLQRAFRRAGLTHALQVVSDGDQAVSYLGGEGDYSDRAKHPLPALILLDLKLPRRSGLEVLEWLRGQPAEIKGLPVIVLTSSRLSEDVDRAYGLGANSYMAKPSGNYDGLAEMVKNLDKKKLEHRDLPAKRGE